MKKLRLEGTDNVTFREGCERYNDIYYLLLSHLSHYLLNIILLNYSGDDSIVLIYTKDYYDMNYETDKAVEHGIELAREAMTFLTSQLDYEKFLRLILTIEYAYQAHGLLLDERNHK